MFYPILDRHLISFFPPDTRSNIYTLEILTLAFGKLSAGEESRW
jgi:hypothetical protein